MKYLSQLRLNILLTLFFSIWNIFRVKLIINQRRKKVGRSMKSNAWVSLILFCYTLVINIIGLWLPAYQLKQANGNSNHCSSSVSLFKFWDWKECQLQKLEGKTTFDCFFVNRDLINYVLFCSFPVKNCLQVEVHLHLDHKEKVLLPLRVVIQNLSMRILMTRMTPI